MGGGQQMNFLNIGDTVQLKHTKRKMVVEEFIGGRVKCRWRDPKNPDQDVTQIFDVANLILSEPDEEK